MQAARQPSMLAGRQEGDKEGRYEAIAHYGVMTVNEGIHSLMRMDDRLFQLHPVRVGGLLVPRIGRWGRLEDNPGVGPRCARGQVRLERAGAPSPDDNALIERFPDAGDGATRERMLALAEEGVSYQRPDDTVKEPTTLEFLDLPVDVPTLERDRNRPSWRRLRSSIDVRKARDLPQEARSRPVRLPGLESHPHLLAWKPTCDIKLTAFPIGRVSKCRGRFPRLFLFISL